MSGSRAGSRPSVVPVRPDIDIDINLEADNSEDCYEQRPLLRQHGLEEPLRPSRCTHSGEAQQAG
jgi:hypothetical protein